VKTAALRGEDPIIGVLGGVFGHGDAKGGALFHALEYEIDTVSLALGHAALPGQDMVFVAHSLLGPLDRQSTIASEGFHPGLIVGGALAQKLLVDHRNADHVVEEVH